MNEEEYLHNQLLASLPCAVHKRMSKLNAKDVEHATAVLMVSQRTDLVVLGADAYALLRSKGIRVGLFEMSDEVGAFQAGPGGHEVYGLFDYVLFSYWHTEKHNLLRSAFPTLPLVWVPLGYSRTFLPPPPNHISPPVRRMQRCNFIGAFVASTDRDVVVHSLNSLPPGACFVRAKNLSSGLHHSQEEGGHAPSTLPLLSPKRYR
jgi:hypothetical protein